MINNSTPTVIRNGTIFTSTDNEPQLDGELHIVDGTITYVGSTHNAPTEHGSNSLVIDAQGGTILPGLIEAHFHATYFNVETLEDLDLKYPVEYVTLLASQNAACALDHGYTSARSGGSLFNVDVWLKKAISEEVVRGPRLTASGREICGVGGLMDWNPDYRKIGMEGLVLLVNGPSEATAAVRKLVKDGVEWIKTYPTGDAASPDMNDHHTLCMTLDEMQAVVTTAHNHNLKVTGHCRATKGIKNALLAGFDAIEHGSFMDDETMDMLLERDVPVVPALYFEKASILHGPKFGLSQQVIDGHQETLDAGTLSAQRIIRAGGRLGLGGDYGFAWNPHGDYAKELTFFVEHVGLTVKETLICATRTGAEIIGVQDSLGTLETGKTADILVVAGDVLNDISLIENKQNLLAVIQNGIIKSGTLLNSN